MSSVCNISSSMWCRIVTLRGFAQTCEYISEHGMPSVYNIPSSMWCRIVSIPLKLRVIQHHCTEPAVIDISINVISMSISINVALNRDDLQTA